MYHDYHDDADLPLEMDLPPCVYTCTLQQHAASQSVDLAGCQAAMRGLVRWGIVPGLEEAPAAAAVVQHTVRALLRLPSTGELSVYVPNAAVFTLAAHGHESIAFLCDARLGFGFVTSSSAVLTHNNDKTKLWYRCDGVQLSYVAVDVADETWRLVLTPLELYAAVLYATVVSTCSGDLLPRMHLKARALHDDIRRIHLTGNYAHMALEIAAAKEAEAGPAAAALPTSSCLLDCTNTQIQFHDDDEDDVLERWGSVAHRSAASVMLFAGPQDEIDEVDDEIAYNMLLADRDAHMQSGDSGSSGSLASVPPPLWLHGSIVSEALSLQLQTHFEQHLLKKM